MAYLAEILDGSGQALGTVLLAHAKYFFPDGRSCLVPQDVAWCRKCKTFVGAERLRTPDEIVSSAVRFRETLEPLSREQRSQVAVSERRRNATLIELVERRQSPARCLDCGQFDFVFIPRGRTQHPEGGESIEVVVRSHLSIGSAPRRFDMEGLPVP